MKGNKHFITKSGNKANNYISNKDFYDAIVEYQKDVRRAKRNGLEKPRITEFIGKCIYQIATNLSNSPSFINYSFKEEMISDGIINSVKYFDNFNPRKYNKPFAYFTQIMIFAFIRRIKEEEAGRYASCKIFQHTILHGDMRGLDQIKYSGSDGEDGNYLISKDMYDNINSFMANFEEKLARQKHKRKLATKNKSKVKRNVKPRKVSKGRAVSGRSVDNKSVG